MIINRISRSTGIERLVEVGAADDGVRLASRTNPDLLPDDEVAALSTAHEQRWQFARTDIRLQSIDATATRVL